MQDSLATGITNDATYEVTADMSPPHLSVGVLGTPFMIMLMEQTCLLAAQPHLDENETTVGVHVCVSHVAAAAVGEEVTVHGELTERDRRKLRFQVEARCGDRVLGEGTHDRMVIDTTRFGS
ncbi:MAG: thioesterase family protein [Actinomycetota bacterium]|nr:thioesterase family protein [Actinomycetota bacterium]